MKILVTGANGLLGQKLVKLLLDQNISVIATSRGESRLAMESNNLSYYAMDITQSDSVQQVISQTQPSAIINTAAMTNVDECETDPDGCNALNVEGVKNLIAQCEAHHCFLLHLSTDFIFDGENGPYSETDPPNPISIYGKSKLKAEQLLSASNIRYAIARTVLVYGITPVMSRSNIILWVKNSLEAGKELQIVDDQWRTPTLAEDLAMGCYLIAKDQKEGIFNISGEELMSPYDMAMKTCEFFSLDKQLISRANASNFSQAAKRPPKTGFILDKAKSQLGYQPHTFEEGISILNQQMSEIEA